MNELTFSIQPTCKKTHNWIHVRHNVNYYYYIGAIISVATATTQGYSGGDDQVPQWWLHQISSQHPAWQHGWVQ